MELLKTVDGIHVVGLDSVNDYYDVSLKEYRLQQIEELAKESKGTFTFIKASIADKTAIEAVFEKYVIITLADTGNNNGYTVTVNGKPHTETFELVADKEYTFYLTTDLISDEITNSYPITCTITPQPIQKNSNETGTVVGPVQPAQLAIGDVISIQGENFNIISDGQYYYVDVTWDDSSNTDRYLLISYEEMSIEHHQMEINRQNRIM